MDGRIISQWEPSAEELDALCKGKPITLILHTYNQPLQPIQMGVIPGDNAWDITE